MNLSKILMLIAATSLIAVYFLPIWSINLDAPQYPEGIGMKIMIDNIVGEKEYDLQNINGLNHYIGMKKIEPDSIAELDYMPYIIGFLIITGIITAFANNKKLIVSWVAIFAVIGAIGLVDFYLWEYDYGHNLDLDNASIIVPGQSYQPPLIGSKKILNFTATSLPASGGIVLLFSFFAGTAALLLKKNTKEKINEKYIHKNNATEPAVTARLQFRT